MGGSICMARTDERFDFLKPAMPPDTCAGSHRATVRVRARDRAGVRARARDEAGVGQCSGMVPRVTVALVWNAVSEMLHLVLFHELLMVITPETLRRGFMPPCRPATSGSSSRGDGAPIRLSPDVLLELRRMESRLLIAGAPTAAAVVALLALPKSAARASSGGAGGAGSRDSSRKRDSILISAGEQARVHRCAVSVSQSVSTYYLHLVIVERTARSSSCRSLAAHGGRPGRAALLQPVSAGA